MANYHRVFFLIVFGSVEFHRNLGLHRSIKIMEGISALPSPMASPKGSAAPTGAMKTFKRLPSHYIIIYLTHIEEHAKYFEGLP